MDFGIVSRYRPVRYCAQDTIDELQFHFERRNYRKPKERFKDGRRKQGKTRAVRLLLLVTSASSQHSRTNQLEEPERSKDKEWGPDMSILSQPSGHHINDA